MLHYPDEQMWGTTNTGQPNILICWGIRMWVDRQCSQSHNALAPKDDGGFVSVQSLRMEHGIAVGARWCSLIQCVDE